VSRIDGHPYLDDPNDRPEKPVTAGYLRRMLERTDIPDDATMMYNGEFGWVNVGPEGEEIVFLTESQYEEAIRRARVMTIGFPVKWRRKDSARNHAINQIKKETGQ
jgi:hypothetical protein